MIVVQFVHFKQGTPYVRGDRAAFKDKAAMRLVRDGYAVLCQLGPDGYQPDADELRAAEDAWFKGEEADEEADEEEDDLSPPEAVGVPGSIRPIPVQVAPPGPAARSVPPFQKKGRGQSGGAPIDPLSEIRLEDLTTPDADLKGDESAPF